MRAFTPLFLIGLCGGFAAGVACNGNTVQSADDDCLYPFGIGPQGTDGICNLGAICLPESVAPCDSNECCHQFCSLAGCVDGAACLDISPDSIPDGGAPGCECDDAGPCICGDAGACYRSTCLGVCGAAG